MHFLRIWGAFMLLQVVSCAYTCSNYSAVKGKIMFLAFPTLAHTDYQSFLVPAAQPFSFQPRK
jgi:hypothetical protein